MTSSQNIVSHFVNINEKAVYASYLISLRIARSGKPHTIGEDLVLPSIKDTVGAMFGEKEGKEIERIPLSNNTVARRIGEMAEWVEDELIRRVVGSKYYTLQLDESTDVQGLSQLLVFCALYCALFLVYKLWFIIFELSLELVFLYDT